MPKPDAAAARGSLWLVPNWGQRHDSIFTNGERHTYPGLDIIWQGSRRRNFIDHNI